MWAEVALLYHFFKVVWLYLGILDTIKYAGDSKRQVLTSSPERERLRFRKCRH